MNTQNLLVELFVEELPPKALKKLGQAFSSVLFEQLAASGLTQAASVVTAFASPRRLAAHITAVASQAADKAVQQKLMPVAVGLGADGQATPALLKKLQALGFAAEAVPTLLPTLKRQPDGKAETLFLDAVQKGASLQEGLQTALTQALAKLPIPKVMSYQLHSGCELPGWSSVSFVRPAHGLVALHGSSVVPVQTLGLTASNTTQGHRFEAAQGTITLGHADNYANALGTQGAVIASFEARRALIASQLQAAAKRAGEGLQPVDDDALLDEVTALVERPHVLTCQFEPEFLAVPQECLILTMKANQKYFPLLDAAGKLSNQFLVVSNIAPSDASAVVQGNERVVRPRLADAKFFFDQDRKKTLESRVEGLAKVVYHNQLGTQGERAERVGALCRLIVSQLRSAVVPYTVEAKDELDVLEHKATQAARLAKTDLLTDMVGEFPELQGVMGGYYARHDGLRDGVAIAIEDHYKPRFAGDALPRNHTGVVLALADKLETLVGMFAIGNLPTGDKDPFALRRHALGVIRMLQERNLPIDLPALVAAAEGLFVQFLGAEAAKPVQAALVKFFDERLAGTLREHEGNPQAYSAQEVEAVLALPHPRLGDLPKRLAALKAFAALPEAPRLAAANKRVQNILRKNAAEIDAAAVLTRSGLQAPEELAVFDQMDALRPMAEKLLAGGDYAGQLKLAGGLADAVDAFFEQVMVMAEDPALRQQRLALLGGLQWHMNQVADIAKLSV